ncbi:hypothetical protein GJAV_G00048940 [Gymnothorax javanicus]|nr:hypothetical protein GJAV_G00048940 [Gymnothorax javanicus]
MRSSLFLVLGLFGVNIIAQTLEPDFLPKEGCAQPKDPGSGDGQDLKFYYSPEKEVCMPFHYKGTGGNENRFDSDRDCMEACSENFASVYPSGAEVCGLPQDPGMCMARQLKFFFSTAEGTCRTFLYGGCTGNGNRFDTREECLQMCRGKSGRSGGGETGVPDTNPDEYTTNTGLIAGIVGGCIFAVAVVSAAVVLIRNKTRGRKKVPTKEIEMS